MSRDSANRSDAYHVAQTAFCAMIAKKAQAAYDAFCASPLHSDDCPSWLDLPVSAREVWVNVVLAVNDTSLRL